MGEEIFVDGAGNTYYLDRRTGKIMPAGRTYASDAGGRVTLYPAVQSAEIDWKLELVDETPTEEEIAEAVRSIRRTLDERSDS